MRMNTKITIDEYDDRIYYAVYEGKLYAQSDWDTFSVDAYKNLRLIKDPSKWLNWSRSTSNMFYFNATMDTLIDIVQRFRKAAYKYNLYIKNHRLIIESFDAFTSSYYIVIDGDKRTYSLSKCSFGKAYVTKYSIQDDRFHCMFNDNVVSTTTFEIPTPNDFKRWVLTGSETIYTHGDSSNILDSEIVLKMTRPTRINRDRLIDVCVKCDE